MKTTYFTTKRTILEKENHFIQKLNQKHLVQC